MDKEPRTFDAVWNAMQPDVSAPEEWWNQDADCDCQDCNPWYAPVTCERDTDEGDQKN